jgi:hypothetical protein
MQKLVFTEHQLNMLISLSTDCIDQFKASRSNTAVYPLDISSEPPVVNSIKALALQDDYLESRGFNKKIMSIGIPIGFYDQLRGKQSISSPSAKFDRRQQDLISVNMHMLNMLKPDIVFKPIKHYFELSRFPVRATKHILDVNLGASLIDIVRAFPTRDISQSLDVPIQYYDPIDSPGLTRMFDDDSYAFMSEETKWQIAKNHVISYLLEAFVKNFTNVDLSERTFSFIDSPYTVDPALIELLVQCRANDYAYVLSRSRPARSHVLFGNDVSVFDYTSRNSTGYINNNVTLRPTSDAIEAIPARFTDQMLHELNTLFDFSTSWTNLSDGQSIVRSLLTTKKFDRIFNVIVDPDDFVIDVEKTTSSKTGEQIFSSLVRNGEIIQDDTTQYRFKEMTISESSIHSYFVSIESYDPRVSTL